MDISPAEYAVHRVVIQGPDGTVRTVPLSEVVSGTMMQSDYTKKTQEVAEMRKAIEAKIAEVEERGKAIERFEAAVREDPEGIGLGLIGRRYGIEPDPADPSWRKRAVEMVSQAMGSTQPKDEGSDWLQDDGGQDTMSLEDNPVIAQLRQELADTRARLEAQGADAALRQRITSLETKYPDFAEVKADVLARASQTGAQDLDMVYKAVMFERGSTPKPGDNDPTLRALAALGVMTEETSAISSLGAPSVEGAPSAVIPRSTSSPAEMSIHTSMAAALAELGDKW
jgi:hypothetical protein